MPKRKSIQHNPELSIIIPTLNEGKTIGLLLESLSKQAYRNFEVIVVDGGSKDKTLAVITRYSGNKVPALQTIKERKRGIGLARNVGAEAARGDYFLFLDADVVLDRNFLKNCMKEFEDRFLDVATCYVTPISARLLDYAMHEAANVAIKTFQYVTPMAPGFCIFATKRMHRRIGGFDTRLKMSEDFNYVERASRLGKFRVLKSSKIRVSVRRLDKEGRGRLALKYLYVPIYRALVGEITKPIFKYEFGKFGKRRKNINDMLRELEKNFMSDNAAHLRKFKKILRSFNIK